MCKILLSYLEPDMQRVFAVYIKLAELTYTLNYLKSHPPFDLFGGLVQSADLKGSSAPSSRAPRDISEICEELIPYSSAQEKEKLSRIAGMFRQMKNLKDMMEMMQMMKDLFPEGGGDLSGILSGITGGNGTDTDGSGNFSFDLSMLAELMKMMNPDP